MRITRGTSLIEFLISGSIITLALALSANSCGFLSFLSHAKAKQGEAKANLKSIFVAQRAYFAEKDTFSSSVAAIGFLPERGNRYSIFNGGAHLVDRSANTETVDDSHTGFLVDTFKHPTLKPLMPTLRNISKLTPVPGQKACVAAPVGCVATGTDGSFLIVAVGNHEDRPGLDNWAISSMNVEVSASADSSAQTNGPGIPTNNVDGSR